MDSITPPTGHADATVLRDPPAIPESKALGLNTKLASAKQTTPPATPISPLGGTEASPLQALFHNYLRAFHDFDPASGFAHGDASSLVTVSIKAGDIILLHSIHANGWADGTVLATGERGWLPTNYCEAYDHPYLRNLLNAMTLFWDLIGDDASLSTFVRQDYIRGLIAGVRFLLEHADCLHRDARLVQKHTGIRRMRKGLLADLSGLVQLTKRLQETISEPFAGEVVHVFLDEVVAKAFRVVTRAVAFVDVWTRDIADTDLEIGRAIGAHETQDPHSMTAALKIDTKVSPEVILPQSADTVKYPKPVALETVNEDTVAGAENQMESSYSERRRISLVSPTGPAPNAGHSLATGTNHKTADAIISEQLAQVHDLCISNIGSFIGLHLHSRPQAELEETSRKLVTSCVGMLSIVDQICAYDPPRSEPVRQARDNFQQTLDQLLQLTNAMCDFSTLDDSNIVVLTAQGDQLVAIGTSLIRSAGDCVARIRSPIVSSADGHLDKGSDGDDELEQPILELEAPELDPPVAGPPTSRPMTSFEKRLSRKILPPIPMAVSEGPLIATKTVEDTTVSPAKSMRVGHPPATLHIDSRRSLPSLRPTSGVSAFPTFNGELPKSPHNVRRDSAAPARKDSVGLSIAGSTETRNSTARDSGISTVSEVSTRATTPDQGQERDLPDLLTSFGSLSTTMDSNVDLEARGLQRTYIDELMINKDGQVTAGSLPALVERLTAHDAAPDPQFVSAFYITFHMFTTSRELATALIARFDYIGEESVVASPVRLRVYNFFKGWLETYWNAEADRDALGDIRYFALHKLKPYLASAGERLVELTRKVTAGYHQGIVAGPLVSHVGKASTSLVHQQKAQGQVPEPVITKSQLNTLRSATAGTTPSSINDFDALELARQITLLTSDIFCNIQPDELLSLDWSKTHTQKALNVRNMCFINTDLAHVVGDTILAPDDAKKRAQVIKQWTKIAACCLELNNYDSVMAIMCSINSSVVQRLRRTWEAVSRNTKERLSTLNAVVDLSRNQASLRKRMEIPVAPCIPFLGIYLTDLTFLQAGNPNTKELPKGTSATWEGDEGGSSETLALINFDKYMRMAKVVSHLQKFQIPYKLQPIPEMQTWMQTHLQRMRRSNDEMIVSFHRRSLLVEPKLEDVRAAAAPPIVTTTNTRRNTEPGGAEERPRTAGGKEKLETFWKNNTFGFSSGRNQMAGSSPEMPPLDGAFRRESR